jgi:hypothetical protein
MATIRSWRALPLAAVFIIAWLALVPSALAEVVGLEIREREVFAGGMAFGETGPYERIAGRLRYAIDPDDPQNQHIIDDLKTARRQ